ncbi:MULTISPECIES: LacI family DNA-binding transcriptional regulator [Streptomycetaceae]|uniref:LacI family transcriptional regulator n=1 Tax=Streptantibioticus cattleyicolor (strain ATCC 35852 / DSM 46488 / JCM 4925 / NBRC 14057 / NRRL 8057) TaxID=1003195 RepID=F8JS97_STREN|nr:MULTISPECIES: LacI family DNA-binding transcriptional regulator [Streptomycetaceae]AEW94208.1 LacI family transcriptional regulator [Streptantibioticus cattleyicolor NRRL 8057 = DSM 46488]MYS58869.1 substrate-binding domain-containing protein [Streptomyces sp. SID5468]CCB74564.1 LacI-family transcriptional regulator [Streptantibioticus cattleyicolor NRRL 8057 = DSM 46488]
MTVTLADVAARAGVSAATVSRVLNGNYPVADSTRERVLRAVDELEYVVNGPARALAAATSDLVGVLVNDIADPFFGILAGAAQTEIARGAGPSGTPAPAGSGTPSGHPGGKLAVVCNTGGSPAAELTYLTLLQRQRAAGVILTGGAVEGTEHTAAVADRLARLAAQGTRIVLCGRPGVEAESIPRARPEEAPTRGAGVFGASGGAPASWPGARRPRTPAPRGGEPVPGPVTLAFDNRGGAYALTAHLLALGHRRIGYAAGPVDRTTTRERLEGHRAALAAHGVDPAGRPTAHGPYERGYGCRAAVELLARDPGLTAVVAANDTIALGVCAALRERGLRVPEDVSVAGFDDLPFSVDAAPALTTVRLPLHEAGAWAGRLVMGAEAPPPGDRALVEAALTVRASTAPPRG